MRPWQCGKSRNPDAPRSSASTEWGSPWGNVHVISASAGCSNTVTKILDQAVKMMQKFISDEAAAGSCDEAAGQLVSDHKHISAIPSTNCGAAAAQGLAELAYMLNTA